VTVAPDLVKDEGRGRVKDTDDGQAAGRQEETEETETERNELFVASNCAHMQTRARTVFGCSEDELSKIQSHSCCVLQIASRNYRQYQIRLQIERKYKAAELSWFKENVLCKSR
jgi:hypothetical protein